MSVSLVTAYGDDERWRQAAAYGAADFLAKPVDIERLKAQLRQLPGVPDCGTLVVAPATREIAVIL